MKPQQRHHDGHIYPQWWGHEEYYQEGYSQAFAEKNKIVEQQLSAADNAQRATAAPAAGLKTQRGPVSLFPVVCEHCNINICLLALSNNTTQRTSSSSKKDD